MKKIIFSKTGFSIIVLVGLIFFAIFGMNNNPIISINLGENVSCDTVYVPRIDTVQIKVIENVPVDRADYFEGLIPPIKLLAESEQHSVVVIDVNGVTRTFHCHDSKVNALSFSLSHSYKVGDIIIK